MPMSRVARLLLLTGTLLAAPVGAFAQDAGKSFVLGYSVGWMTDTFQGIQVKQTLKAAALDDIKTLPVADANADPHKQQADVQQLIGAGAQGLILVPTDSTAVVPALQFSESKNVPVVSIDVAPTGGRVAMIVRANNLRMGEDACDLIGTALGGKGKVLSLQGEQATVNGHDRTVGFNTCMAKKYPGVTVVEQPTHWNPQKATEAARATLAANPDLNAMYLQSDGVMLSGVLDVLKAAGKLQKVGAPGHMYLVTIDGTPASLQAIRDGLVDKVIAQPLNLYVEYGLAYLERAVGGETFKPGPTDHDSEIVSFNGNPMDLLPAPIVTAANVDSPNFWGNQAK